jgi:hypothetical protein
VTEQGTPGRKEARTLRHGSRALTSRSVSRDCLPRTPMSIARLEGCAGDNFVYLIARMVEA